MLGFLIGAFMALCSLMVDHSVLDGLSLIEMIVSVISLMLIFGVFGAAIDLIIQFVQRINKK